jgi:hypothetical protein
MAQWRQASVTYAIYHLQSLLHLDKDGDIADMQRCHTTDTANRHYGIDVLAHPDIPSNIFHQFENISAQ